MDKIPKVWCDECDNKVMRYRVYNNKFLCYKCYCKAVTMIYVGRKKGHTLKKALNKIYEFKGSIDKKGNSYDYNSTGVMPKKAYGWNIDLTLKEE